MPDKIRFGRAVDEMPVELEFGEWGTLPTANALDLFQEAHSYFDLPATLKAEKARRAYIRAAWDYYDGKHIKPLIVRQGEMDDNILLNFCRTLVDDSVAWLWGHPETGVLQIEVDEVGVPAEEEAAVLDDANTTQMEAAIAILNGVYTASGGFPFFQRWGKNGTMAGHFFIKLVPKPVHLTPSPSPDQERGAGMIEVDQALPARLVVLDPELVSVMTDPADTTRALAFKVEWERAIEEDGRRQVYLYRQLVVRQQETEGDPEAWVIGDFRAKKNVKRSWELVNGPFAWPWQWCPIVDGANLVHGRSYYGMTDLEDVTGVNDAINFSASNTGRILKIHGHPKTVGTGFTAEEVQDTAIDSFWTVPNPEAKISNLEMQSDLSAAQNFVESLKTAFWTIGRGLDLSVFKDKLGQITNFGLHILAHRALNKNGDKRILYGDALKAINARVLEMAGLTGVMTSPRWPDPLPLDPVQVVAEQEAERRLGVVSKETIAEERGRVWAVEKKRMEEEQKETMNLGQFMVEQFDRGGGMDEDEELNAKAQSRKGAKEAEDE